MTERRAYIRHISVRHREQFLDALHLVLKHVWTALKADTVRIDLYHFEDESNPGPVQADKEIKAELGMNRRGFKWKTLINDIKTGTRYQIMQMARPADFEQGPPVSEPLTLKAA